MKMARLFFALSVAAIGSATVVYAAGAKEATDPQFASVKGRCLRVSIGDQDLTKACSSEIGRSLHSDGRSGLYFFMGATHIITFTGIPSKEKSRDKSQVETLKLDEVILNDGNTKSGLQRIAANGACNTSQINNDRFLVACTGTLQKGTKFSASFEIDKSLK